MLRRCLGRGSVLRFVSRTSITRCLCPGCLPVACGWSNRHLKNDSALSARDPGWFKLGHGMEQARPQLLLSGVPHLPACSATFFALSRRLSCTTFRNLVLAAPRGFSVFVFPCTTVEQVGQGLAVMAAAAVCFVLSTCSSSSARGCWELVVKQSHAQRFCYCGICWDLWHMSGWVKVAGLYCVHTER